MQRGLRVAPAVWALRAAAADAVVPDQRRSLRYHLHTQKLCAAAAVSMLVCLLAVRLLMRWLLCVTCGSAAVPQHTARCHCCG